MAEWGNLFNQTPQGSQNPGSTYGPRAIRETRSEFQTRVNKEHLCSSTSTVDGFHRAGSFKCYYTDTEPQFRPDGTTELGTQDNGRKWINSTYLNKMVWDGSMFKSIGLGFGTLIAAYDYPYDGVTYPPLVFNPPSGWENVNMVQEKYNTISGVSLDSGGVSLPIGKYVMKGMIVMTGYPSKGFKMRLYNLTKSSVVGLSSNHYDPSTGSMNESTFGFFYTDLDEASTIRMQIASEDDTYLVGRGLYLRIWKVG